jgi:hypothetical protein
MTGGLPKFLQNNYFSTVSFAQIFQDSVDIFEDYLYDVF